MQPVHASQPEAAFKSDAFVTVIARRRATIKAVRLVAAVATALLGLWALHEHSWIPLLVAVIGSALMAPLASMWSLHRVQQTTGMPPHQQMMLWERYVDNPNAIDREIADMQEAEALH